MTEPERDPQADQRRDIVRRATMYSAGFLGAALVVATIGAAFVAWLLTWRGLPFLRTWLVLTAIVVLPGLAAGIWKLMRE